MRPTALCVAVVVSAAVALDGSGALLLDARAARQAPPAARGALVQETDHLTVRIATSERAVAPGARLALVADVVPKPNMHVYAPQQKEYIPVSLTLNASDTFKPHAPVFPRPETYFFEPLNETQLVYTRPFRIVQDITLALTPELRDRAKTPGAALTITGTLRYQACDDAICYLPKTVPLEWKVALRPLQR